MAIYNDGYPVYKGFRNHWSSWEYADVSDIGGCRHRSVLMGFIVFLHRIGKAQGFIRHACNGAAGLSDNICQAARRTAQQAERPWNLLFITIYSSIEWQRKTKSLRRDIRPVGETDGNVVLFDAKGPPLSSLK